MIFKYQWILLTFAVFTQSWQITHSLKAPNPLFLSVQRTDITAAAAELAPTKWLWLRRDNNICCQDVCLIILSLTFACFFLSKMLETLFILGTLFWSLCTTPLVSAILFSAILPSCILDTCVMNTDVGNIGNSIRALTEQRCRSVSLVCFATCFIEVNFEIRIRLIQ